MFSRGELAKDYFLSGYNCCQSVVLAFSDLTDFDEKMLSAISRPFGTGMGGMRETCGTVSGMWIVLGAVFGDQDQKDPRKRNELYSRVRELANRFEEANGSLYCRELLGLTPVVKGKDVFADVPEIKKEKRPCPELVKFAADLLQEYIEDHKSEITKAA